MRTMMKRVSCVAAMLWWTALAGGVGVAHGDALGDAQAQGNTEVDDADGMAQRRVPADPHGEVEIVNVAGSVQVSGWDRPEVLVDADMGRNVKRLKVESDSRSRRTWVKVEWPPGLLSSRGADLVVKVPRDSALTVNTISADQQISEVRGVQRLQAVSGEINTQVWSQELAVKTIGGNVTVRAHKEPGVIAINTVSGDVTLADVAGELNLETVTGDMKIGMDVLTRGRIRTTNGDLRLGALLAKDSRLDAEAINGDLSFRLRPPVDAEFDIATFNGEIDNCFGPKPAPTHVHAPGNNLRFSEGDGSARVRVKTLNGGVELCRE